MSSIAFALPTRRVRRCVPPVPGRHAERDFGQAGLAGALARDADVGRHRDLEAAADAVAVDRGDDQLRRLLEARQRLVGVQAEVVLEVRIDGLEHVDVRAGAEELLARARDQDDEDLRVEARLEDALVEVPHHLVRVGVRRRIVEREDGDAALLAKLDQLGRRGRRRHRPSPFELNYSRSNKTAMPCPPLTQSVASP
jgi:hypothetical protein